MPYNTQDLTGITSLEELPIVPIGCDSSASWAARFRHLSTMESVEQIAERLVALTPSNRWISPSGEPIHLVITGGEPLLAGWQRAYPALLECTKMNDLRHLTFETNGTQKIQDSFHTFLHRECRDFHLNWSVSPKLSISGEDRSKSIRPEVLKSYAAVPNSTLCLKFVVAGEPDFHEAVEVTQQFRDHGVDIAAVYAMPVGALASSYAAVRDEVAQLCIRFGIRFSTRLHIDLFGNRFGT